MSIFFFCIWYISNVVEQESHFSKSLGTYIISRWRFYVFIYFLLKFFTLKKRIYYYLWTFIELTDREKMKGSFEYISFPIYFLYIFYIFNNHLVNFIVSCWIHNFETNKKNITTINNVNFSIVLMHTQIYK